VPCIRRWFAAISPVGAAALGLAVSGMGDGTVQVAGKPPRAPRPLGHSSLSFAVSGAGGPRHHRAGNHPGRNAAIASGQPPHCQACFGNGEA
jgi:hypothetical protein